MVDDFTASIVQLLLFVSLIKFVHFHFDTSNLSGAVPSKTFVAVVVVAVAAAVIVVLAVPRLRNKVLPSARDAVRSTWTVVRDRRKRLDLFGGAIATEVIFALTLGASASAYGVHLSLAQLLLVNVGVTMLAGLIPVPGGIGAAEAGLAAGLVAMGVPEATAFAIAITHRLCTYYLPPVWGYFSLEWLRRKGNV